MLTAKQAKTAEQIGTSVLDTNYTDITIPNEYVEVDIKYSNTYVKLTMTIDFAQLKSGNYNYLLDLENHPYFIEGKKEYDQPDIPSFLVRRFGFGEDRRLYVDITIKNPIGTAQFEFYKSWVCKTDWDYRVWPTIKFYEVDDMDFCAPIARRYDEDDDEWYTHLFEKNSQQFSNMLSYVTVKFNWPTITMLHCY